MRNYRELRVWQEAHKLSASIYAVTASFPRREIYGLTSQIRRASVSIEANLAEGCGRQTDGELARFIQIAMGSASELDCELLLAHDLTFLEAVDHRDLSNRLTAVRKMLSALLQAVQEGSAKSQKPRAKSAVSNR